MSLVPRAMRRGDAQRVAGRVCPPQLAMAGAGGPAAGGMVVIQDISHIKALERQRDRMLAMVAHDLRNPLTGIYGTSQILQQQLDHTADLPHLFEQYYRASNVAATIPGNGIGLAGVRHIAQSHGGTCLATRP